jgi:hypothetical protein
MHTEYRVGIARLPGCTVAPPESPHPPYLAPIGWTSTPRRWQPLTVARLSRDPPRQSDRPALREIVRGRADHSS